MVVLEVLCFKTPAKEVAVIVVSVVTKTSVVHIALQTVWPGSYRVYGN